MRIVIVTTQVPFITGGAEYLARGLKEALERAGHEVELVAIPFKWYPPERIPEHILACRMLDLTESCGEKIDLLIGLKFPAYYIKHPNKILWILHQHRPAYDLWGTDYQDIPLSPAGLRVREIIIQSDNQFIREAKKVYTISKNVSSRLKRFNNIDSQPLYHPPPYHGVYYCDRYGDYLFFPSRIGSLKRQILAVEAMAYVRTGARLVIGGRADSKYALEQLLQRIKSLGLEERVQVVLNMSEEEKREYYANCRAVLFVPYDEDYGYVTLEAMYARKPVITCTDSGGPTEFIKDGINGFVVDPDPKAIAGAIDSLFSSEELPTSLGTQAYHDVMALDLSWDRVTQELLKWAD